MECSCKERGVFCNCNLSVQDDSKDKLEEKTERKRNDSSKKDEDDRTKITTRHDDWFVQ